MSGDRSCRCEEAAEVCSYVSSQVENIAMTVGENMNVSWRSGISRCGAKLRKMYERITALEKPVEGDVVMLTFHLHIDGACGF